MSKPFIPTFEPESQVSLTECTDHERQVLEKTLALLRRSKVGAIIITLKESGQTRFWANGQPAGIIKH
jgi:hypothetical protein